MVNTPNMMNKDRRILEETTNRHADQLKLMTELQKKLETLKKNNVKKIDSLKVEIDRVEP